MGGGGFPVCSIKAWPSTAGGEAPLGKPLDEPDSFQNLSGTIACVMAWGMRDRRARLDYKVALEGGLVLIVHVFQRVSRRISRILDDDDDDDRPGRMFQLRYL